MNLRRGTKCCLAALALLSGCASPPEERTPAPSPSPTATLSTLHVVTEGSAQRPVTFSAQTHNRRAYTGTAKSSVGDRMPDGTFVVALAQPHVTFYDKAGKTLIGDAPRALVLERSKIVTMSGGVHAVTQDGTVLTCDQMTYDGAVEKIHGTGNVVLTSPKGDRLTGDTIDGDVRLNHVTVLSHK